MPKMQNAFEAKRQQPVSLGPEGNSCLATNKNARVDALKLSAISVKLDADGKNDNYCCNTRV